MGVYAGPANAWSNFTDQNRIDASTKVIIQDGLVLNLDAGASTSYPGSGTSWTDLSGNGNNGTLVNGVGYDSANGGSLSFDGSNDYISISTNENYNFGTENFSIECWVNFNALSANQIFVSKYLTWTTNLDFVLRYLQSTSRITFLAGDNLGMTIETSGTTSISTNTWYHVCVTRLSGLTTLYINTISQGSHTGSVNIPNDKTELRLGLSQDADEPFNGKISNFRIYKGKGLTAAEVQQNYNALKSRYQ